jgi:hypothetical protein
MARIRGEPQPPLCHFSNRHIEYFIGVTVNVITEPNFEANVVTIIFSSNTVAKETIGGSIFRSQVTVIHTNLVVGFVFVLTSADDLQLVNFSGTNVEYQGSGD